MRSAHSAYGNIYGQSFTLPSHAFASPRSIFLLAYGMYAVVSVNRTPCLAKNPLALSESSSPRSAITCPTHPYLQNTSSKRNWHTAEYVFLRSARPSTWFVRSSRAKTKYLFCLIPVGMATMSTIHLKLTVSENVGCSSSRCRTLE